MLAIMVEAYPMTGADGQHGEGTPDPHAIGILACAGWQKVENGAVNERPRHSPHEVANTEPYVASAGDVRYK